MRRLFASLCSMAVFFAFGEDAVNLPQTNLLFGVSSNVCAKGRLDLRVGTLLASEREAIAYSPQWGGAESCVVSASGASLQHSDEGEIEWTPPGEGCHVLTHTAGDVTYTARFVVLGNGVVLHTGEISEDEVWGADKVHLVDGALTVASNVTLTVARGAVVKFTPYSSLDVADGGACSVAGAIFTHVNDDTDTVGGDTLGDGGATAPAMGQYAITGNVVGDAATQYRYLKFAFGVGGAFGARGTLDLRKGTLLASEREAIAYSPQWGGAESCVVSASGASLQRTDEGEIEWTPPGEGCHVLTHTAGDVTYTARFVVLGDGVVLHTGEIMADEVWGADKVHLVDGALTVASNVTLTVARGAVVKFTPYSSLDVADGGACSVAGAIFTHVSDDTDTVGGDTFGDGGATVPTMGEYAISGNVVGDASTQYRYLKFAFGVGGAFGATGSLDLMEGPYVAHEKEAILYSPFWGNGNTTIVKDNGVVILPSADDEGSFEWMPQGEGIHTLTHESGTEILTAQFMVLNNAAVHDGVLSEDVTWGNDKVHVVSRDVSIKDGTTLTIEPGAVVKFLDGKVLTVEAGGVCVAEGVVFTSIHDDTAGGDTLCDGDATASSENGYAIVGFVRDDLATEYRYGVQSYSGTLAGEVEWRKERTYVIDGTLTVATNGVLTIPAGTVVKFTDGSSIKVADGGVCIAEGVIFTHIADDAVGGDTMGDGDETKPEYGKYTVDVAVLDSDATEYRYSAPITTSGTISGSVVWRARQVYHVTGNLTLASGATLSIAPGTVIKFDPNVSLTVNSGATLNAQGTRSSPIVFTSIKDDAHGGDTNGDGDGTIPNPGDWVKICVNGGTANFNYAKVLYSSKNATTGAINMTGSGGNVVFVNGEIAHAAYDAIGVESGNCHVTNSVIHDCLLAFRHWTRDPIVNCVIYDCGRLTQGGGQHFYNCIFSHITETWEAFGFPQNGTTYNNCCFWNEGGSVLTAEGTQDALTVCGKDGNIWADPKLVDPENGDFRIAADSPCVDAGDATMAPAKDWYGQPRYAINGISPLGTPGANGVYADIGIYELQPRDATSDVDLEVTSVTASEKMTVGEFVTVSWREANVGSANAVGTWYDKVELVSASGAVVLLGTVRMTGIPAGGEKTITESSFRVPAMAEGACAVRVTANYTRPSDVNEGSLTANNVCLSEAQSTVALPTRGLGSFNVSVAAGQSTSFGIGEGVTSLFVADSHGALNVSMRVVDAETGRIRIVSGVAVTGGVALSLPADMKNIQTTTVTVENGSSNALTIRCEASTTKCAVVEYTPERIGNKASSVISLIGYGMDYVANVKLSGNGANVPCSVLSRSTGELAVNVESAGCGAGTYTLALELSDGNTLSVGNIEMFSNGIGPKFEAEILCPLSTRIGRVYSVRLRYRNAGDADMLSPCLSVVGTDVTLGFSNNDTNQDRLNFLAISPTAPAGVLKAGEESFIDFFIRTGQSPSIRVFNLAGNNDDWVTKAEDLACGVTRLNMRGRRIFACADIEEFVETLVSKPDSASAACGRILAGDAACAGIVIAADDEEGNTIATDTTDDSGRFVLAGLGNSTNYTLHVVSGAVANPMNITMPRTGDLLGVTISCYPLRTLNVRLAGVKTNEVMDGTAVLYGMGGEVLGKSDVAGGLEIHYSSSNLYDTVLASVRLKSGRIAEAVSIVSPYDSEFPMEMVVDFSAASILKARVVDAEGVRVTNGVLRIRSIGMDVSKCVAADAEDYYVVGGIPVGKYVVDFISETHNAPSQEIVLENGVDLELLFSASRLDVGTVSVSISGLNDEATLVAESKNGSRLTMQVTDGNQRIGGISFGDWDFYILDEYSRLVSPVRRVSIGNVEAQVVLCVVQEATLSGEIRDSVGAGISGTMIFMPDKGAPTVVRSDEYGLFNMKLPKGEYWVECGASNFVDRASRVNVKDDGFLSVTLTESVTDGEESFDVDLDEDTVQSQYERVTVEGKIIAQGNVDVTFIGESGDVTYYAELIAPTGSYVLVDVPAEYKAIWATDGYGTGTFIEKDSFENAGNIIDMNEFQMGVVKVTVYADEAKTEPLPGVDVWIIGGLSNRIYRTSDAFGGADFRLSPGEYSIVLSRDILGSGYSQRFNLSSGGLVSIDAVYKYENVLENKEWFSMETSSVAQGKNVNMRKGLQKNGILDTLATMGSANYVFSAGFVNRFLKPVNRAFKLESESKKYKNKQEPTYPCSHNAQKWKDYDIARMEFDSCASKVSYDMQQMAWALLQFKTAVLHKELGYVHISYALGSTARDVVDHIRNNQNGRLLWDATKLGENAGGFNVGQDAVDYGAEKLISQIDKATKDLQAAGGELETLRAANATEEKILDGLIKAVREAKDEKTRKAFTDAMVNTNESILKRNAQIAKKEREIAKLTKALEKVSNAISKLKNIKVIKYGGKVVKIIAIGVDLVELYGLADDVETFRSALEEDIGKEAAAFSTLKSLYYKSYDPPCPGSDYNSNVTNNLWNLLLDTLFSHDPNEMVGPTGVGEARCVKPGQQMDYTIYFENQTNATAAACDVYVTLPKNAGLDWDSFELGEVVFGDNIDTSLSGKYDGESSYALPGTNWSVRTVVEHTADAVRWHLRIIDPTTPDNYPSDAYAGFLPPNDETGRGEGHLRYRVKVRDDAEPGSIINASASIVFDYNDPIETDPAWWNTVGSMGAQFATPEVSVDEGGTAEIRVSGGNADKASSVKVYLTYNTAAAADLNLGKTKFPLTLTWEKGEVGEKVITIPTKVDTTVEDDEFFTLQLADAEGMEVGEERVCTVTIRDLNDKTLKAAVTAYKPKKGEAVATNSVGVAVAAGATLPSGTVGGFVAGTGEYTSGSKLTLTAEARPGWAFAGWRRVGGDGTILSDKTKWQIAVTNDAEYEAVFEKIPYVRGLADPADGGKVSGSGLCASGKKVTLKASANKNFTFVGWTTNNTARPESAPYPDGHFVATTPSLVIDRSAKPAANSKTSTTVTEIDGDVTYFAVFKSDPKVTVSVESTKDEGAALTGKGAGKYVAGTITGAGKYAPGKKVTLKAAANKGYVFAGWGSSTGGTPVVPVNGQDARSPSVSFAMPSNDVEIVAQFVTEGEDADGVLLAVDGMEMRRVEDAAPHQTNVMCGVYMEWPVAVEALSLPTVAVAGLPTGLKFTAKPVTSKVGSGKAAVVVTNVPANTIYGTPTAASKVDAKTGAVKPSEVKVTVTTAGKSKVVYEIDVTVDAIETWVVGTFDGYVRGSGTLAASGEEGSDMSVASPKGLATVTVSAAGKISGKVLESDKTWTLSAANFDAYDAEAGVYTATVLGKSGKESVTNEVAITEEEVRRVEDAAPYRRGVVTGGGWAAWQNLWKAEPWKTDAKPFAQAPALTLHVVDGELVAATGAALPSGTISLKFASSGAVTASGKFVTGQDAKGKDVVYSASCSPVLIPVDGDAYAVYLYFPPKAGKFEGYAAEVSLVWDGAAFSLAE